MIRTFLFLVFSMQLLSAQVLKSTYSYSFSDYYDPLTQGWKPSKCDCDYEAGHLTLGTNGTFSLTLQQGRLDPQIQQFMGKCEIENDTVLILYPFPNQEHREGYLPVFNRDRMYIRQTTLFDGSRTWN